eukprot:2842744-Rhodomonas_salina.1
MEPEQEPPREPQLSPRRDWNEELVRNISLAAQYIRQAQHVVLDCDTAVHLAYFAWSLCNMIPPDHIPPSQSSEASVDEILRDNKERFEG